MAIKKVLITICFTPILFAFYYRVSDCYGDFSVAWSTAEITHASDEARCSYAFAQATCMREADMAFQSSTNKALADWERCINEL